jgi:hypothetical protein
MQEKPERHFGATIEELAVGGYGDIRRVAVAWALLRKTTIRQFVIADLLNLKSSANVSQRIKQFEEKRQDELSDEVRNRRAKYSK